MLVSIFFFLSVVPILHFNSTPSNFSLVWGIVLEGSPGGSVLTVHRNQTCSSLFVLLTAGPLAFTCYFRHKSFLVTSTILNWPDHPLALFGFSCSYCQIPSLFFCCFFLPAKMQIPCRSGGCWSFVPFCLYFEVVQITCHHICCKWYPCFCFFNFTLQCQFLCKDLKILKKKLCCYHRHLPRILFPFSFDVCRICIDILSILIYKYSYIYKICTSFYSWSVLLVYLFY